MYIWQIASYKYLAPIPPLFFFFTSVALNKCIKSIIIKNVVSPDHKQKAMHRVHLFFFIALRWY